jgi:hypothetical protein
MALGFQRIGWIAALAGALLAAPTSPGPVHRPGPAHRGVRKATLQGRAVTPGGAADGRLDLYGSPGKGGLERLAFTLYKAGGPQGFSFLDGLRSFHFGDFEGPDAPAAARRLTQVQVLGPAGTVRVRLRQNGYYSAEVEGGFVFDTGASGAKDRLELQKVFRALRAGGTSLVIRVNDSKDPKVWVQGEFSTAGTAEMLTRRLVRFQPEP